MSVEVVLDLIKDLQSAQHLLLDMNLLQYSNALYFVDKPLSLKSRVLVLVCLIWRGHSVFVVTINAWPKPPLCMRCKYLAMA